MPLVGRSAVELKGSAISVGKTIKVSGPLGCLMISSQPSLTFQKVGETLLVVARRKDKEAEALRGTVRSLLHNMVTGVSDGFRRGLVLVGVGYKASSQKGILLLSLGFSQVGVLRIVSNCRVATKNPNEVEVFGLDRQLVNQTASQIKRHRPSEPYKGKGIHFSDEAVKTKERKKKVK